jgi:molybdate transport system permease protein
MDIKTVYSVMQSPAILAAMRLSAATSGVTVCLCVLFAIPMGYALSRYRFPGHLLVDTLVDLPMVLPPVVVGVSLLVFFQTAAGRWLQAHGPQFVYTVKGIVLCQFLVAASYAVRASKAAFDSTDVDLEHLALTLGCTHMQAFRWVALPQARNGIVAGAILAWAKAVGLFGPLMVFAGAVRMKTEVMPTTIFLELSIGEIERALAVSLVMLALAAAALIAVRVLSPTERR